MLSRTTSSAGLRAVIALTLAACCLSVEAEEWRVGIGGAWGTGYAGLFARHGLPRERLLDSQLADIEVLRQYSVIVVGGSVAGWGSAEPVMAQYVSEGGCALLECTALPSPATLPGQRISPQAGPNFVLEGNHPALGGLPAGKTYTLNGYTAGAIIPDAAAGATVLARFTEQGAPDKVRGKFVVNGQSVPAIVYRPLGRGHLVYSGPWMAYGMALSGRDYSDLIFALMAFMTEGNVRPRLTLAGPNNLLTTRPWGMAVDVGGDSPAEVALPEGFELVENLAPFEEYDLKGALTGPLEALLDYRGPGTGYRVTISEGDAASITSLGDAGLAAKASKPVAGSELVIARRHGSIAVRVDGRTVVETADLARAAGAAACKGLGEPLLQPVQPVFFTDDFMRESGQAGDWQVVSGNWQTISSEGAPATGANPFSYGVQADGPAIVVIGDWTWSDYQVKASARWTGGPAGIAFHYRDPNNYDLLEADQIAGELRYVRVRRGEREQVESALIALRPWQWYALRVQASHGLLVASVDHKPVFEVRSDTSGAGLVGLYASAGKAAFDDVSVRHWLAAPDTDNWRSVDGGSGEEARGGAEFVVRGKVQAPEQWSDVQVSTDLRLAKAPQAGVRLRDTGDEACVALVERGGAGLVLKLIHERNGKPTVLGSAPIPGAKPTGAFSLLVKAVGDRIFCAANGKPLLTRAAALPKTGFVGLFTGGNGQSAFSGTDVRPADSDLRPADPPTPEYAGNVDVMTWAGPAFSWLPDPSDLSLYWHEGRAPGALRLRLGVHKAQDPASAAQVYMTPASPSEGYIARFNHTWGAGPVSATLSRAGKTLAEGAFQGDVGDGFMAEVEAAGGALVLSVNGAAVAVYNDPDPTGTDRVGVRVEGAPLCYDDLLLERSHVRDYTFTQAPADWIVQRGTWEVTSRWTCSPGWTWLSGLDSRHAMVQSKWQVEGDVQLETYVGAKMMQTPSGRKELLQEIRLGICGRPGFLNAGYFFLIGAKGGRLTALQRNGLTVAEAPGFVVIQGSVHNDWLRLSVRKRGDEVALLCQGQPVISYSDPEPLPGGTVCFGTYDNGLMFPRLTVHGAIKQ